MKSTGLSVKMKTGFNKYWSAVILFMGLAFIASPANAIGTMIVAAIYSTFTFTTGMYIAAMAINIAVSMIVAKNAQSQLEDALAGSSQNPGNRQSAPPATNNKLPVIYGSAWVGGTVTDMVISNDNQWIYYVIALSEVTNNGSDVYTFGDIYYTGRKVILGANTDPHSADLYTDALTSIYLDDDASDAIVGHYVFGSNIPTNAYVVRNIGYVRNRGFQYEISNSLINLTTDAQNVALTFSAEREPNNYAYKVVALNDPSTSIQDTAINDNLYIYLYNNGINSQTNSPYSAYTIMNGGGSFNVDLTYKWTNQQMTNCAFAIVQMQYNQEVGTTGFQQMKFQINNPRNKPGDCFLDYFTNSVYGAGLTTSQVDTNSLTALNNYCAESFTYTTYSGSTTTQQRFQFNGMVDTNNSIMNNLQEMATSCDCLIKYNEVTGLWGVIVQQPTYTVAMAIDDSNMIGSLSVSPLDISNSYNIIEAKFPDNVTQDGFNTAIFDLAQIAPNLLYPNEPINKQTVTLSLVNNSVTAQYIANRLLEAGREDLSITCKVDYTGLQLEAGDIVSITNTNYGWNAKLFRISKITEQFGSDGTITADLILSEYNPQIFDDRNITQFTPAVNTSLPSALVFGYLAAPIINNQTPTAPVPFFYVNVVAPNNGVTQYAEIYYSAYLTPTSSQLIFAGTTDIKPSGDTYAAGQSMPPVVITGVASGDWYFFYKIVNNLGASALSAPSSKLYWRPMTFQYSNRYLMLAYADDSTGLTGFSYNPRNKIYFGVYPTDEIINSTDPTNYKWFPAIPNFGTTNYLLYANWGNRSASFATGTANYFGGSEDQGNFVSTNINYSGAIWSGVIDPIDTSQSYIDLDKQTGQQVLTGSTTNYGALAVQPSTDGRLQVALNKFISFGSDANGAEILQKTVQPALLTVDIYGRVVGFENADNFYVTIKNFTATSGQTVFNVTRDASYRINNCLVFENGTLVDISEYTDTAGSTGTVTFSSGRTLNDRITIISFRSYHLATAGSFVIGINYTITNLGTTTNAQWNTIAGTTGITYAVGSAFTCANIGAGMGTGQAYNIYDSFTRYTQNVSNVFSITPTSPITSGFEYLFINGIALLDPDYDIDVNGNIINLPTDITTGVSGTLTVIQWAANNLSIPNGNPYAVLGNTSVGQSNYTFGLTQYAFNLYINGVFQINGTTTPSTFTPNDYTTVSGGYTLSTTPANYTNFLLQQSFTRTGAA